MLALLSQCQPLAYPESMLLVHHHEGEPFEPDILFDQGVGPYDHAHRPLGDCLKDGRTLGRGSAAEQEADRHAERAKQGFDHIGMLPCQDLGRRQQDRLKTCASRVVRRHGSHHRLPRPHVSLEQPVHGGRLLKVLEDLPGGDSLSVRQFEGEP